MKTGLTPDAFEKLLRWLDPDRDTAGAKYEKIRLRLIRVFSCRGCGYDSEDLADDAINVVATKVDWLLENYEGNPALYFYGVAKKIYLEHLKTQPPLELPPLPDKSETEQKCACLEQCLEQEFTQAERNLVLTYHEKEKGEKIRVRKQICEELGISINALRIRVYHLHSRLRPCIEECLRKLSEQ
jgi:DNA-directed RNA polymerase specialized sigma24 family protein